MSAPDFPFVALRNIAVDGTLAFVTGDFVPADTVTALSLEHGVDVDPRDIPAPDGVIIPGTPAVPVAEQVPVDAGTPDAAAPDAGV